MSIISFPFVKLAIALIAGLLLANLYPDKAWVSLPHVALFAVLMCLLLRCACFNRRWLWHRLSSYALFGMITLLYAFYVQALEAKDFPSEIAAEEEACYAVLLLSEPIEKPKSYQCRVRPLSSRDALSWSLPGKWQVYLAKDSLSASLQTGDVLYLRCRLQSLQEASFLETYPDTLLAPYARRPKAFDYHRYLRRQAFVATAYVPGNEWCKEEQTVYLPLRRKMEQVRKVCVQRYEQAGLEGEALALISALTLGQKSLLEEQQRDKYSLVGVSHILAVSGMHVGIICQLVGFLLGWMRGGRFWLCLRQVLLILLLWLYAFLTGLSASVLRAVIMYTVAALALCLRRRSYTWNALAFAACIMLLFRPAYCYDLGFQLSFLAVMSILLMQPYFQRCFALSDDSPLQSLMTASSSTMRCAQQVSKQGLSLLNLALNVWRKILAYFKELLVLSLAAQIGTAPLSVYYFHQFSNYFWLSNCLLVPLALPLTYLGIFWQILADVPWLNQILAALLDASLQLFMKIATWLAALPVASSQHLYPTLFEVVVLYAIILALFYLAQWKKWHYFLDNLGRQWRYARRAFKPKPSS